MVTERTCAAKVSASKPEPQSDQQAFLARVRSALGFPNNERRRALACPALFASSGKAYDFSPPNAVSTAKTDETECAQGETITGNAENCADDALYRQLSGNAELLNLQLHRVASLDEAGACIADIARNREPEFPLFSQGEKRWAKQIVQHEHPDIQALQLKQRLEKDGIAVQTTEIIKAGEATSGEAASIRAATLDAYIGVTVAEWGVAESATIVQRTLAGRPRSTSLVPSVHIAVLRRENLLATLNEVYDILREQHAHGALPDSFVFISGPSKTADIEAVMVHGAHGPREMHLIVVG